MKHDHDDLLFILHDVARLTRIKFDQRARSWGMTRAQCVILMKLDYQPGMCQTELAALLEVEPITVARLIDRLEANGLVVRRPDPSDRRMHRLHILPAASPILAEIARYRTDSIANIKTDIADADWDTALRVLNRIKDTLIADTSGSRPAAETGE